MKLKPFISWTLCVVGLCLLGINTYGLFKEIRPKAIYTEPLRFHDDIRYDFDEAIQMTFRLPQETDSVFARRVTFDISKSLAHIPWKEEPNPDLYHQRVPVWENYILFAMSYLTTIPEYTKYHYANYKRSLERGIGNCGDASMILSQVLEKNGIPNQILSFPGHVVVAAMLDGEENILDADFGVNLPFSAEQIHQVPSIVNSFYLDGGYTIMDTIVLNRIYAQPFKRWNGTSHFITKKYYFEILAYWVKWPLPVAMLLLGFFFILRKKKKVPTATLR